MKKIIFLPFWGWCFLLLGCPFSQMFSQEAGKNCIVEKHYMDVGLKQPLVNVRYHDCFGYEHQLVKKNYTVDGQDLVYDKVLDASGRVLREALPVHSNENGKLLKRTVVDNLLVSQYGDEMAYIDRAYERSGLQRLESVYGAGEAWRTAGRDAHTNYFLNNSATPLLKAVCFQVNKENDLIKSGDYQEGTLRVTCNIGEDKDSLYNFIDKMGQLVLTRQICDNTMHDTYYVYDTFGMLVYVLPPLAVDGLNSKTGRWSSDSAVLSDYAYYYKYDNRQRLLSSRLPGCREINRIYDKYGRVILRQVDNWQLVYTAYDNIGRVVETGTCTLSKSIDSVRQAVSDLSFIVSPAQTDNGYNTAQVFSSILASRTMQRTTFYDDYSFRVRAGFGDSLPAGAFSPKGRVSGTITLLSNYQILKSILHYDNKGRIIKQISENHLGGLETECFSYNFSDQVLERTHTHSSIDSNTLTERYYYVYDSCGRLFQTKYALNDCTPIILAEQVYDAYDYITCRKYHDGKFTTEFSYNLRGWLTNIDNTLFSQKLYYTDGVGNPCFNGNISSMTWKTNADSDIRGYCFEYDALSRLRNAAYGEGERLSLNDNHFSEQITGYDKNGNILGLKRYGQISAYSYGLIDNLTFTLAGNQLKNVNDSVSVSAFGTGFDFKDGSVENVEYFYDANGNLTKDLNKKIVEIQYNFLNLPHSIQFENGDSISFVYSGEGTKLRTTHVIKGISSTTDYCGNAIYENGVAKLLLTEYGYITLSDTVYHYFLQDHQGNNRMVVDQNGTVEEVNHYYPFGGVFARSGDIQPYKYNGKELDRKNGLDWCDYGARRYDPVLGRWNGIDPSCEKHYRWGPYDYCKNNPVLRIDPDGKDDYVINYRGRVSLIRKTDRIVDVLYASGTTGTVSEINPEWKNIRVFDKSILPALETNLGNNTSGVNYFAETSSAYDAANIVTFGVDNTGVEWRYTAGYRDGERKYIIGNSSREYSVSTLEGINNSPFEGFQQIVDIHSHPSTQGASEHDMLNAKGKNNVSFGVYFKDNKTLYEYNSVRSNLNSIKMNSMLDLMRYTYRQYNKKR